jgi:hypothetical protein
MFWRGGVVLAVLVAAGSAASQSLNQGGSPRVLQSTAEVPPCRSDPHAGVHDPTRLKVLDACATFVGTVTRAPKLNPSDRDVTFNAAPDSAYASMLNEKNRKEGGIHIEIVPIDQPGCTLGQPLRGSEGDLGLCSGANVIFPPLGAHVRVIGPHVYDTWVGWNEIHPAWKVEILTPAGPPPPETHLFKARLTGKTVGEKGAPRVSGRVALTVTAEKMCWRFTRMVGIGRPRRATIRAGGSLWIGPALLALGPDYKARGCATPAADRLTSLVQKPRAYYVTVATARHRLGAIRGRLEPASD